MKHTNTIALLALTAALLICASVPVASAEVSTNMETVSVGTSDSDGMPVGIGTFSDGYRAGYKKAYPMGLCPIPPIPPIGRNTYEDGYGMGYAQGLLDKPRWS